jgi:NAD(P)-dependent dehydrogenase (short-subunit alcohol dehydrogenase family)
MENRRVALVSGANRGIGRQTVSQLAERGITTILGSREEEKGRAAAEGMGGDVHVRRLGVTYEKGFQRLATDTLVWAALPDNGSTGGFFRDRRPIPW